MPQSPKKTCKSNQVAEASQPLPIISIDLIRRKLAREPQIHGGKKSRVVFTVDGEKSVPRDDRS